MTRLVVLALALLAIAAPAWASKNAGSFDATCARSSDGQWQAADCPPAQGFITISSSPTFKYRSSNAVVIPVQLTRIECPDPPRQKPVRDKDGAYRYEHYTFTTHTTALSMACTTVDDKMVYELWTGLPENGGHFLMRFGDE